jgi:hypothetical protein
MTRSLPRPSLLICGLLLALLAGVGGEGAGSATAPAKTTKQPEEWQNELVAWLRAKPNGYFSHKIVWQLVGGSYNMFAAEDIAARERLMVIPQAALITSRGTRDGCVTVQRMLDEYDKGAESDFYPYLRYLFDGHEGGTRPGLLPTSWSAEAQALLKTVIGDDLLPDDINHGTAIEHCGLSESIDGDDPVRKQRRQDAFLYWISRSWSDKMVPILDMINHRNGEWLNVESTSAHVGRDIIVYALKPIKKGEQLYNTYNECLDRDCDDIKYTYVTPHILADYGFVDAYPKRWMFEIPVGGGAEEHYDVFVVDVDENAETGKPALKWNFRKPTEAHQWAWIEKQLERLKGMEAEVMQSAASLSSSHEKNTILDLFNGYKEAFELALIHRDDEVVTEDEEEDEEGGDDDEGEEL